ncbi:MAG: hypothetical protein GF308_21735 [Candidatus Heimdallarchaeota archaeon]|nr:hypothetical protein [Candidatus Heimdallarchaeota archaeon]
MKKNSCLFILIMSLAFFSSNFFIELSAITLTLNTPLSNQPLFDGECLDYDIDLDAGDYVAIAETEPLWEMDLKIVIATDASFTNILVTEDSFGSGMTERGYFNCSTTTIYIRISSESGDGFFDIIVSDDINYGYKDISSPITKEHIFEDDLPKNYYLEVTPNKIYVFSVTTTWSVDLVVEVSFDPTWVIVNSIHNNGSSGNEIFGKNATEHEVIYIRVKSISGSGYYDIKGEQNQSPQLTHPKDISYEYGLTGNSITWTITDSWVKTTWYKIYKDLTEIYSGSWISGDSIICDIDGLDLGNYSYKLEASDGYNSSEDTVLVGIVNDQPQIICTSKDNYFHGVTGNNISWTITDRSVGTTTSYTIRRDGNIIETGSWESDIPIVLIIDDLDIGTYTFSFEASDGLGGIIQDEINITVIENVPAHPSDTKTTFWLIGTLSGITIAIMIAIAVAIIVKRQQEQTKSISASKPHLDIYEEREILGDMITCFYCGTPLDREGKQCSDCGMPMLLCSVCKKPISFGDPVGKCSLCEAYGHLTHLQEWVKVCGKCPNCDQSLPLEGIVPEESKEKKK